MNKIMKEAFTLFAITLVAGILLGVVYTITKQPIANQEELSKQTAYKAVMTSADSFASLQGDAYTDSAVTATFAQKLADADGAYTKDEVTDVVAGMKDGKVVGLVITMVAKDGYAGDIKFSVGISSTGEYLGTSLLSISETAGLGMRAKTNPDYLSQFNNKTVQAFTLVKDGSGASSDEAIDAMSGSTVTSKAILRGINAALVVYRDVYAAGVKTVGGVSVE